MLPKIVETYTDEKEPSTLGNKNCRCNFWWNLISPKLLPTVDFGRRRYQAGNFSAYFLAVLPTETVR